MLRFFPHVTRPSDVQGTAAPTRFSEHNGFSITAGDNWLGQIASAVMRGPHWRSTVLFIPNDDCSCLYDQGCAASRACAGKRWSAGRVTRWSRDAAILTFLIAPHGEWRARFAETRRSEAKSFVRTILPACPTS